MRVNTFVKSSKQLFCTRASTKQRIVIGNQSADLDSIVSAISFAFYQSDSENLPTVPIINSTRQIIATKKECMYLFEQMSIELDDLIFIEDLKHANLEDVFLVDHNELDCREKVLCLESLVRGVVDHHQDKGGFRQVQTRLIDTRVGSNTSIIVSMFFARSPAIQLDATFADMMLYPILFDTYNLSPQQTHEIDSNAVDYLRKFAQCNQNALYAKLDELKFSTRYDDNVFELLQRDCKFYGDGEWAMSSLTLCLEEWLQQENTLAEIVKFMDELKLSFLGLLSIYREDNNTLKRELCLLMRSDSSREAATSTTIRIIKNFFDPNLSIRSYMSNSYVLYDVGNYTLTRKYWQPRLNDFWKRINNS